VVDDASVVDYSHLKQQYPQVNWLRMEKNGGPGVARQYGTERSNGTYITYIDSGDTFNSNTINTIFDTIISHDIGYVYIWKFYDGDSHALSSVEEEKPLGKVFKREFLERYNIKWPDGKASYACEDYGFVRFCKIMLGYLKTLDFNTRIFTFDSCFGTLVPDNTSLTHNNNFEFVYNQAVEGLINNNYYIIK